MNQAVEELLHQTNPWWRGKDFKAHTGILRERYVHKIFKSFSVREIKILYGVRRSGKSTLLYQLIQHLLNHRTPAKNVAFVNFENNLFVPVIDQPSFLDQLLETIQKITNPKGEMFLFLDEIQEVKGWEKWANKIYEQKRPIHLVFTGSSSSMQSTELATLLTGRNLSFEIKPLDFQEYLLFKTGKVPVKESYEAFSDQRAELKHYFEKYLKEGGFPGIVLTKDPGLKDDLLRQYFQDILYRDLIRKHEIRQPLKLEALALYLISNMGRSLSYRSLAGTLNIAVETLKEYLIYFERSGLFSFLPPFSFSLKPRLRDTVRKKIYVADVGLRNAAAWNIGGDTGFLVENLIFQLLKGEKSLGYTEDPEIDFAFIKQGSHLVQVCYADSIPPREVAAFQKTSLKSKSKILISKDACQPSARIRMIPAW